MMIRYIKLFGLLLLLSSASTFSLAQEQLQSQQQGSLRDRLARRQQQAQALDDKSNPLPQLSVRAQMRNQNNTPDLSNATWTRGIYRLIDLTKGPNGALFYPVTPLDGKMNLYTMIFKLVANNQIKVYEFNDSQPVFTERFRVKPEDMFDRLEIGFADDDGRIVYDEYNIPSNEVLGYYIKEIWYFDQANSVLDVKIDAICPVLYRNALDGFDLEFASEAGTKEPQFWIPYENIRPYATRMPVMTSDLNNIENKTIDDFFILRLYEGDIYKTTNMENKFLLEKYKTPEELKAAQEKIEKELIQFGDSLWVINDSVKVSNGIPKKRTIKSDIDRPKGSSSASGAENSARERRKIF